MKLIHRKSIPLPAKIIAMAFCGVALMLQGCDFSFDVAGIKGSGVQSTKSFDLEPFDEIEFSGSGKYNINCGGEQSVSVTFDDNLMEFIETKVENGKLKIGVTESYSTNVGLTIDINLPALSAVEVNGAGTAKIINFSGEKLSLDISGAATVIADGTVDSLHADASGACSLNLLDLVAKNCSVDMSGAGGAKVNVTEKLTAKISGVGSVKYKGDPEVTEDVSGIGSVSKIK